MSSPTICHESSLRHLSQFQFMIPSRMNNYLKFLQESHRGILTLSTTQPQVRFPFIGLSKTMTASSSKSDSTFGKIWSCSNTGLIRLFDTASQRVNSTVSSHFLTLQLVGVISVPRRLQPRFCNVDSPSRPCSKTPTNSAGLVRDVSAQELCLGEI